MSAYAAAVFAVATGCSIHSAKAAIGEQQLELGRDLLPLAEFLQESKVLEINGQRAHIASTSVQGDLSAVLDRYEAHCLGAKSVLSEGWKLAKEEDRHEAEAKLLKLTVSREEKEDEGTVACVVKGARSAKSFTEAAQTFAKSGDFGAFGKLRYVYAKRGSGGSTFVMTVWTDDTFELGKMLPQPGQDVAGGDLAEVPRPPQSQRIFVTALSGAPFSTRVYQSAAKPEAALAFYDDAMKASGWIDGTTDHAGSGRVYLKNGTEIVVATRVDDRGQTSIAIAEVGRP
ncbi:MAG: hypothetical protein ABIP39_12740 [Polyangiaceae bacterium]